MELIERIERAETELVWSFGDISGPGPALLGLTRRRFGSVVALAAPRDTLSFWSQAIGFGLDRPVTSAVIGEVLDHLEAAGCTTAALSIMPGALPPDWDAIATSYGITAGQTTVQVARTAGPVEQAPSDFRIAPIGPQHAEAWAQLQVDAYGMPDAGFRAMLAAYPDWPGTTAYAAWDGDTMVATGSLHIVNGVGRLRSGATHPAYRGRGAQSALLTRRTADAFAQGCDLVTTGSYKPAPGQHNPSLANMLRLGFEPLAERTPQIWRLS
ncbi:GNAT family N-acetyltransferase [Kribbella sp. NPDC051770]|uniref:GNAT family N-acetyltransferase n=1 Tax=Kribbella sp. NPDC051770 TaxID=3155413 RepID=UPI00342CA39F